MAVLALLSKHSFRRACLYSLVHLPLFTRTINKVASPLPHAAVASPYSSAQSLYRCRKNLTHTPPTVKEESFDGVSSLKQLYLDRNLIEEIHPGAFASLSSLKLRSLTHNQLVYLPNMVVQGLKIETQKSGIKLHGACAWPPYLSEEPLENVKEQDLRCRQQDELMPDDTEKEGETITEDENITPNTNSKKNNTCPKNCYCESDARHATCEERGHTKVPTGFLGTILLLNMHGNHFHYLPGNSFPNVPEVVSLHLDGCKIHEIEGGAFQGMKKLMYLYLFDNQLASLDTNVFAGAHDIMYLQLEGNRLSQFPSSEMLAHIPKLLELHLERNLIVKLELVGFLNPIPQLTGLNLATNTITNIVPKSLDSAPTLDVLHLGDNKLTEVPSDALVKAPLLTEVHLSGNLIRWIGPRAFQGVAKGLKHLYIDRMGLQKMSAKSLAWFGPGLVSLSLEENQLKELPDLSPLTGLQHLTLGNNPLMWLSNASLKVEAVCGYPSELQGQSVIKAGVLKNCSGENNQSFNETSITTNEDKLNKPFHSPAKARPAETDPKPAETKMTAGLLQNSGLKPDKKMKTRRLKKKNRRKKTKH
ncbi:hypothetical protein E1301_Tti020754 [Triplophysa tibetana]|uniref:Chondroadherin-like protein n=1 Tax=Triplophysa tibetana TaxID=1572043 RepID=A0A5A9N958_9TELE|nr:hypothetical protein E1301_Tti020754 [Triplophysa tibetana]